MTNIEIYGQKNCRFCVAAVQHCMNRGYRFEYHDISDPIVRAEMLERAPATKTVPQIFVGHHHIGGHDQLVKPDPITQQLLGGN